MSNGSNGHATLDGQVTTHSTLEQLQSEMGVLLHELTRVAEMSPIERQRLQGRFELKSLEIKRAIVMSEHDDLVEMLPSVREEIDVANRSVKSAQERYREALNRFNSLDDRRKRLLAEVDQIQRECEGVRLRVP